MTSTLHKCVHCHTISIIYLCPRKTDPRTVYEYDCHTCEGLNRFVPVKCIEQLGELPNRATCAQPVALLNSGRLSPPLAVKNGMTGYSTDCEYVAEVHIRR